MAKHVGYVSEVTSVSVLPGSIRESDTTRRIVKTNEDRPDLALPTARVDAVVPYVVGRVRVTQPNFIWYGNVQNIIEETTEVNTYTNESRGTDYDSSLAGYTKYEYVTETVVTRSVVGYRVDTALAICLGPGVILRAIYAGKDKIWEGTLAPGRHEVANTAAVEQLGSGFIYNSGEFDQTPDPYMSDYVAEANLPGYVGIAYIILKGVDASVMSGASYSFEVQRLPDQLGLGVANTIGEDLNPASAIADVILNNWGAIGVAPEYLDNDSLIAAAAQYSADGLASSFVSYSENFGLSLLNSIQEQTRSIIYVDPATAKIKVKALRSVAFDLGSAISLDNTNTSAIQRMEKDGWSAIPTHLRVSFENREKSYESDFIMSINPSITPTGDRSRRVSESNVNPAKTQASAAASLALQLTYESAPQLGFVVQANRVADDILPGEPFLLSWNEYGLFDFPVFASKIVEQGSTSNYVLVTCQQYENTQVSDFFSLPAPSQHVVADLSPQTPDGGFVMGAPYYFLARSGFAQSLDYLDNTSFPFVLPKPANEFQLTADVYSEGARVREDVPYALHAKFARPIKLGAEGETYITPHVMIKDVINADLLVDQGEEGVRAGNRLIVTEYEIMGYETVTNNGDGTYTLNNVHRGLLDTCPTYHDVDDAVTVVDQRKVRIMQFAVAPYDTVTLDFYSRSHKGLGREALSLDYVAVPRSNAVLPPKLVEVGDRMDALSVVEPGQLVEFDFTMRRRVNTVELAADNGGDEIWNGDITTDLHGLEISLIDSQGNYFFIGTNIYGDVYGTSTFFSGVSMDAQIPPDAAPGTADMFFGGIRMDMTPIVPIADQETKIIQRSAFAEMRRVYIKPPLDIVVDIAIDYEINP